MSELTNVARFKFTIDEIKITIDYLSIDSQMNKELIRKFLKFGFYIKKINNN